MTKNQRNALTGRKRSGREPKFCNTNPLMIFLVLVILTFGSINAHAQSTGNPAPPQKPVVIDTRGNPIANYVSPLFCPEEISGDNSTDKQIDFEVMPDARIIAVKVYAKNQSDSIVKGCYRYHGKQFPFGEVLCLADASPITISICLISDQCCRYSIVSIPKPRIIEVKSYEDGSVLLATEGIKPSTVKWDIKSKNQITRQLSNQNIKDKRVFIEPEFGVSSVEIIASGVPMAGACYSQDLVMAYKTVLFNVTGKKTRHSTNGWDSKVIDDSVVVMHTPDTLSIKSQYTAERLEHMANYAANKKLLTSIFSCRNIAHDDALATEVLQQNQIDTLAYPPIKIIKCKHLHGLTVGNTEWVMTFKMDHLNILCKPKIHWRTDMDKDYSKQANEPDKPAKR